VFTCIPFGANDDVQKFLGQLRDSVAHALLLLPHDFSGAVLELEAAGPTALAALAVEGAILVHQLNGVQVEYVGTLRPRTDVDE